MSHTLGILLPSSAAKLTLLKQQNIPRQCKIRLPQLFLLASEIRLGTKSYFCVQLPDRKEEEGGRLVEETHYTDDIDVVITKLHDQNVSVRLEALRTLASMKTSKAVDHVLLLIDDPATRVRRYALRVLPVIQPMADTTHLEQIARALESEEDSVRMEAAMTLWRYGHSDIAQPVFEALLQAEEPVTRKMALSGLKHIYTFHDVIEHTSKPEDAQFGVNAVVPLLTDDVTSVREAACAVLGAIGGTMVLSPLIVTVSNDHAPSVRLAAAQAMNSLGDIAIPGIRNILTINNSQASEAIVSALRPDHPELRQSLASIIEHEIAQLSIDRQLQQAMPEAGNITSLIRATLEIQSQQAIQRIVKMIGIVAQNEVVSEIAFGLSSQNHTLRLAALNKLQQIAPTDIYDRLYQLVANASEPLTLLSTADAVQQLLQHVNPWLRALAAFVVVELQLSSLREALEKLLRDTHPFVTRAAEDALSRFSPVAAEQTPSMTIIERVLHLHDVTLFHGLPPSEMRHIADIAVEMHFNDGDIIGRQGDAEYGLYIIIRGHVDRIHEVDGEIDKVIELGPATYVGELALIELDTRLTTLQARGDVTLLVVPTETFADILKSSPTISETILKVLAQRVRHEQISKTPFLGTLKEVEQFHQRILTQTAPEETANG